MRDLPDGDICPSGKTDIIAFFFNNRKACSVATGSACIKLFGMALASLKKNPVMGSYNNFVAA